MYRKLIFGRQILRQFKVRSLFTDFKSIIRFHSVRDQWILRSPQQLVSQTSRLACQVTEISVDIPSIPHLPSLVVRIPKRPGSPVETQSTPRRTKRRRTLFISTS